MSEPTQAPQQQQASEKPRHVVVDTMLLDALVGSITATMASLDATLRVVDAMRASARVPTPVGQPTSDKRDVLDPPRFGRRRDNGSPPVPPEHSEA